MNISILAKTISITYPLGILLAIISSFYLDYALDKHNVDKNPFKEIGRRKLRKISKYYYNIYKHKEFKTFIIIDNISLFLIILPTLCFVFIGIYISVFR